VEKVGRRRFDAEKDVICYKKLENRETGLVLEKRFSSRNAAVAKGYRKFRELEKISRKFWKKE
jgi:hypothetical protein